MGNVPNLYGAKNGGPGLLYGNPGRVAGAAVGEYRLFVEHVLATRRARYIQYLSRNFSHELVAVELAINHKILASENGVYLLRCRVKNGQRNHQCIEHLRDTFSKSP